MKKNWRVYYFGCLDTVVSTGRITKRKAKKVFKHLGSAIAMEKVAGISKRKIFKDDTE